MPIQATIRVSNSLKGKKKLTEDRVESVLRSKLLAIAETAVGFSPVDTGAYVTSHSIKPSGSSYGRGVSSRRKPPRQEAEAKAESMDNLRGDISAMDVNDMKKVTLRNDSPHAQAVEYKHGYAVFAKVRNIHG